MGCFINLLSTLGESTTSFQVEDYVVCRAAAGATPLHLELGTPLRIIGQSSYRLFFYNPFRTAVPFWGQTTWNQCGVSPNPDCSAKRLKLSLGKS